MSFLKKDTEENFIVQAAQASPQFWALGIGTLLLNGIVLILGNAFIDKMLAAEKEILIQRSIIEELEASVEHLEEGATAEGLGYRMAQLEDLAFGDRMTKLEDLTNANAGQIATLED